MKELIERLKHYKTIGVKVNVLPYFAEDIRKGDIKELNRADVFHQNIAGIAYQRKKLNTAIGEARHETESEIEYTISKLKEPEHIKLYILKNTTEEQLKTFCDIIDEILELQQKEYEETECYLQVSKVIKSDIKLRPEQKEEPPFTGGDKKAIDSIHEVINKCYTQNIKPKKPSPKVQKVYVDDDLSSFYQNDNREYLARKRFADKHGFSPQPSWYNKEEEVYIDPSTKSEEKKTPEDEEIHWVNSPSLIGGIKFAHPDFGTTTSLSMDEGDSLIK